MPDTLFPTSADELREALATAAASKRTIQLFGGESKRAMGGPVEPADVRISTARMRRILLYEPRDSTISVEAGVPFAELSSELARNGQMIPLEGPFSDVATVGGMVAANIGSPRRRVYGTARDLVIGTKFATLDGKLVQSGGMVVKNVAGLDMSKVLIGSFGTLAALATINFKLIPKPVIERTVLFGYLDIATAIAARDSAIRGVLNPSAVEIVNPALSAQMGMTGYTLALAFGGNRKVIERIDREVEAFGKPAILTDSEALKFWESLRLVTPRFLQRFAEGAVVRLSTPIADSGEALAATDGPAASHAGSGVVRAWFQTAGPAAQYLAECEKRGWTGLIEFAGKESKRSLTLWPSPGNDFEIMKEIKRMFDPQNLLNRGRLYNRI